jgi:hypothetical protein
MNTDLGASAITAWHEFCALASGPGSVGSSEPTSTATLPFDRHGVNRHA